MTTAKQTAALNHARAAIFEAGTIRETISDALDNAHKLKAFKDCSKLTDILAVIFPNLPKGISASELPTSEHYSPQQLKSIRYFYQKVLRDWAQGSGLITPAAPRAKKESTESDELKAAAPVAMPAANAPSIGASITTRVAFIMGELKQIRKEVSDNANQSAIVADVLELLKGLK